MPSGGQGSPERPQSPSERPERRDDVIRKEERDSGEAPPEIQISSDEGFVDIPASDAIKQNRIAEARTVMGFKPKMELKDAQGQSDSSSMADSQ